MKRIHIIRKKTIIVAGIAAVSLAAAAFIPMAVRAHSRRKHTSV